MPTNEELAYALTGRPPPMQRSSRDQLLMHLSALAGGPDTRASLDELQSSPGWSAFVDSATAAGFEPEQLVTDRNRNIGDYESGGFAKGVGDFMDRSGLGDLVTYGTILTAGAGAAGAFGGGAAGGAGGAGGGATTFPLAPAAGPSSVTPLASGGAAGGAAAGGGALAEIGLPASASHMAVPGGPGVILPGAGSPAVMPASEGIASMPPANAISGGGAGLDPRQLGRMMQSMGSGGAPSAPPSGGSMGTVALQRDPLSARSVRPGKDWARLLGAALQSQAQLAQQAKQDANRWRR